MVILAGLFAIYFLMLGLSINLKFLLRLLDVKNLSHIRERWLIRVFILSTLHNPSVPDFTPANQTLWHRIL